MNGANMPKRRRRMSKDRSQAIHARRRSLERYGIDLSSRKQILIVGKIQRGESEMVERQSLRISVHEVELEDEKLRVVYDKNRQSIVTVLPKGCDDTHRQRE
jgi:hypothetical protein